MEDLNIDKNNVQIITVKDYGHSDIINNPYRDIMHYSRISLGNSKRNKIKKYHKFLSNVIKYFVNFKKDISEIAI